jgi:MFS family permease
LISLGLGSYSLDHIFKNIQRPELLKKTTLFTIAYLIFIILISPRVVENCITLSFPLRIVIVSLFLAPLGLALGIFFPAGLTLLGKKYPDTIAWAWGINGGLSVLGSIGAIILAQIFGFNNVLVLAMGIYAVGVWSYLKMDKNLK